MPDHPPIESLEPRRLLASFQPAFAAQIGLGGVVTAETTFDDEFDGAALDPNRWQIREGARWRDTPASTHFTWTHRDAIQVADGNLTLTAFRDAATGLTHSAWIQTSNDFTVTPVPGQEDPMLVPGYTGSFKQRYGYWEARVKMNALPGAWGAFWVHSPKLIEVRDDPNTANHPEIYGTEYDVAEMANVRNGANVADEVSTVVHANGYRSLHRSSGVNTNATWVGPSYSSPNQFHVYGLLWTPTSASFYIDGNLVQRETDPALVSKVAQTAMFSTDVGAPGSKVLGEGSNYFGTEPVEGYGTRETSPVKLTADYIRVWQLNGEVAPVPTPAPTPTPAPRASLAGTVFTDANANGLFDAGESARPDVVVYIDLNYNGTRQDDEPQTITLANGTYRFDAAPVTNALVVRVQLAGTTLVRTTPTGDGGVWLATNAGASYALAAFGVRDPQPVTPLPTPAPTPPTAWADISGTVFNDPNANARRDANESGLPNVRVYLDLNMNARRDADEPTTLTNASGAYRFDNVRPANALAIRLDLTGTTLRQTTVGGAGALWLAPAAGTSYGDQTFGAYQLGYVPPVVPPVTPPVVPPTRASAVGSVYFDYNRNARRDAGEGAIAGTIVYVDADYDGTRDADELYTATLADGTFRFDDVQAGVLVFRVDARNVWYTPTLGNAGLWRNLVAGSAANDVDFAVVGK